MKIAIIGTGDVGTSLGKALLAQKYAVNYGSRNPQTAKVPEGAKVTDLKRSVKDVEMVFLAMPSARMRQILDAIGKDELRDKIIVDATNVLTKADDWAFEFFQHC